MANLKTVAEQFRSAADDKPELDRRVAAMKVIHANDKDVLDLLNALAKATDGDAVRGVIDETDGLSGEGKGHAKHK